MCLELVKQIQGRNKEINWLMSETGRRICPIVTDVEKQKASKRSNITEQFAFLSLWLRTEKKIPFLV
jgi:hypothetical protein